MSREAAFIQSLRALGGTSAARGLADDAAVLALGGATLVLTHDMLVEGVHFLAEDPPGDVAWKLVAVNLSDLAAKGAKPIGALMGYSLAGDGAWDAEFVSGLALALAAFGLPLLGGDTVSLPAATPRMLGLTALGQASSTVPSRAGASPGDRIWVSGAIGDAGLGLAMLTGKLEFAAGAVERYRRPRPRLESGQRLAPLVSAMMDVSDGLLVDAARMAAASGVSIVLELADVPLSDGFLTARGDGRAARLEAATAGDDYELLFAAPPERGADILALGEALGIGFSRIGEAGSGAGLSLRHGGEAVALPARLGWEHG